jgi:cytidine diphosphoramidate kinase
MNAKVYWITGLSAAGKTTLAAELAKHLRGLGESLILLDGDEIREVFRSEDASSQNHGRESRLRLSYQYSRLCKMINIQGITVVIGTIAMFKEIHVWNRKNLSGYIEVYLKVPLEERRRRDPKGIYERFYAGELQNVAGLDLSIDEPINADIVVDFDHERTVESIAEGIVKRFKLELN